MAETPKGAKQLDPNAEVFLGGSCNPTTWRADVAVPLLEAAGIVCGNPQIDDYDETDAYFKALGYENGCADVEAVAKKNAKVLLFVIDGQTRATASCVEVAELAAVRAKDVVLVVQNMEDGVIVAGQAVTGRELKDLNGMRKYLREEAKRYGVQIYATVEEAVQAVIVRVRAVE